MYLDVSFLDIKLLLKKKKNGLTAEQVRGSS